MENKLQELTRKLYDEGLEKGRAEADKVLADARKESEKIVADARAEAAEILRRAKTEAEDVGKNTMTEIALAGKQAVAKIKSEIASLIVAKATAEGVKKKLDKAFDASAKSLLAAGVEVGWSKEVKTGFKVGTKGGGYYISFSDEDVENLLSEYLRDRVSQMLFKA